MTLEVGKIEQFIDSVKDAFKGYNAPDDLNQEVEEVIKEIEDHCHKMEINNPVPTVLPVCRHLNDAYNHATKIGPIASIIDSVSHLMPNLVWQHGYTESEMSRDFADNFGNADVIGPHGLVFSPNFKLGVVLLGPETFYPPHAHSSTEIYYILSGEAEWYTGNEDDKSRESAGSMIFHPSNQQHAMLSGRTSLLAVYTWRGDIHTGSKLL